MTRRILALTILVTTLLAGPSTAQTHPRMSLRAQPAVAFYPNPVNFIVLIEPRAENRAVVLASSFGSSAWEVQGEKEPSSMKLVTWKDVPPGEHEITLSLLDNRGRLIGQVKTTIRRVVPEP